METMLPYEGSHGGSTPSGPTRCMKTLPVMRAKVGYTMVYSIMAMPRTVNPENVGSNPTTSACCLLPGTGVEFTAADYGEAVSVVNTRGMHRSADDLCKVIPKGSTPLFSISLSSSIGQSVSLMRRRYRIVQGLAQVKIQGRSPFGFVAQ